MIAGSAGAPLARGRLVVAAVTAAALLATAACQTADAGGDEQQPQPGGTLRVSLQGWVNYLDPQLVQQALELNLSHLVTRTLTGFRPEPGAAGSELVPDLATDTGRPSENNTVWEFTLRDGARWEDGEPVTCQDLKYGVERRFSELPDRQSGAGYPLDYLQDNKPAGGEPAGEDRVYKGPWVGQNNNGEGLASVECVDQRQIRFHLNQPRGDFNYTVSLPVFGPVRPGTDDDRDDYNLRPLSNGPYLVSDHQADPEDPTGNLLVLERNPHWDAATDPHRPAYPDRIEVSQTTDIAVTTNALVNDQGDDRSRILLDWDIAPTFLQQVMTDPQLSQRVASGPTGAVRYLAINTVKVPDQRCRQALAYAINKRKFRSMFGGSLLGELATSMVPPNLRAHQEFDHYGTGEFPDGQPDRARQILDEAEADGVTCFEEPITFTYPDDAQIARLANTVVESYQRIGVQVTTEPMPPANYFAQLLGDRHGDFHVSWVGWIPDWPNGSAVIPPLFQGCDPCAGTNNLSYLNDPQVDDLIEQAFAEEDLDRQYLLWGDLDSRIQQLAATIPILFNNGLRMHGSNVRGAFMHPQYAMPDLSAIGLADPAVSTSAGD
ncbi:MAG: ABC transporter substrate-binding protein [Natronosporangium sp.]